MSKVNSGHVRLIIGFILIIIIALLSWHFNLTSYFNMEKMRQWIDEAGYSGPVVFIGLCIAGVMLHVPEIIIIAIGGVLFGGVKGFIYGWVGSITGSTITFLFVRYFMKDVFQKKVAGRYKYLQNIDEQFVRHGFKTMLFLRIVLFMSPPLNWFIAVTRVKFSHYMAGSMLGIIPGIAITSYVADNIAGARSLSDLITAQHIIPLLLIVIFIAVTSYAAWKLLSKSSEKTRFGKPPHHQIVEEGKGGNTKRIK